MSTQLKNRWTKSVAAVAVSAALWAVAPAVLASGETTGGVTGVVQTTSGASVGGAVVHIKNLSTGAGREVSTDENGSYRFPQLPPGDYEITVSQGGRLVAKQNVAVRLGGTVTLPFDIAEAGADVIEVVGARPSAVDLTTTDSGLVIGKNEIDALPVAQNMMSVALLAPGTVAGDKSFGDGNLTSFSGASVAENVCYINGMNVTDPDKGLGCGSVPFEMFKEFQIKTGGYSAQFGRATGGVINAVTKSGGNEFEFDARVFYTPESWRAGDKKVQTPAGRIFRDRRNNFDDTTDIAVSASGPIIQDKLFFYAIYNPIRTENGYASNAGRTVGPDQFVEEDTTKDFWGVKLDWEISDNHRMEFFGFSDQEETDQTAATYQPENKELIGFNRVTGVYEGFGPATVLENGGVSKSITYSGNITDDFSVKAMYGEFGIDSNSIPFDQTCPNITDSRTPPANTAKQSCIFAGTPTTNEITRTITRIDFDWAVADDHQLKFGFDKEEVEANHTTAPAGSGDAYGTWTYNSVISGAGIDGTGYTNNTNSSQDYVQRRVFAGGGDFTMDNSAIYIEDSWTINDQLSVQIGVRNDEFSNAGKDGVDFVKVKDQIAPRLGVSFDPTGDGSSKLFATWGRYYFPIPVNTNYRVSSGIRDVTTTYVTSTTVGQPIGTALINPVTGTPILSNLVLVDTHVNSSGSVPQPELAAVPELKPMYLEELIIGYQTELSAETNFTVRGIMRDTKRAIDDHCDTLSDPSGQGAVCTLFNPGHAATFATDINYDGVIDRGADTDGDGIVDTGTDVMGTVNGLTDVHSIGSDGIMDPMGVTGYDDDDVATGVLDYAGHAQRYYTADQIGMPKSKRTYTALQFEFAHKSADLNWTAQYTWSRNFGNNEGGVKSDNEQTDTGITTDFDFRGLMDGADGYLPNDRRHVFKFFGNYSFADDWRVSWNSLLSSGRPFSATGRGYPPTTDTTNNPNGYPAPGYGDTYWIFTNGTWIKNERGSMGRTPVLFNLDVGIDYSFEISNLKAGVSLDVFNVLNLSTDTKYEERAERSRGNANQFYGYAKQWQDPREVRLGLFVKF